MFKIHAKAVLLEHIIAMVPLTQYTTMPIQIVRCVKVENILLRQQLQFVLTTVQKVLHVRAHMMVIHGISRTITKQIPVRIVSFVTEAGIKTKLGNQAV